MGGFNPQTPLPTPLVLMSVSMFHIPIYFDNPEHIMHPYSIQQTTTCSFMGNGVFISVATLYGGMVYPWAYCPLVSNHFLTR